MRNLKNYCFILTLFVLNLGSSEIGLAQIFKRYCPTPLRCPPATHCPPVIGRVPAPSAEDQFADPEQFLVDPNSTVPQADPNLSVPQSDANLFAANPQAGELGGLGQSGYIAGNQFVSGARIRGTSFSGVIFDPMNDGYLPLRPELGKDGVGFTIPIAGGDRRVKLSDQFSPFPENRIFYTYHHFGNPALDSVGNDVDVNRNTFGIERAFHNGNASIEIRIPVVSGVGKNQDVLGEEGIGQRSSQLGNIAFSSKFLMFRDEFKSFTLGLGGLLPTAPNGSVSADTQKIFEIHNQSISLLPYYAINLNPDDRTWLTFFSQADFILNGDRVSSFIDDDGFSTLDPFTSEKYNQQHLLAFDLSLGRWIYRNPTATFFRGFAPFFELHYTTTLNDTDEVIAGSPFESDGDRLLNVANRLDILDTSVGFRAQFGSELFLTASFVAPLRTGDDKSFDSEFNLNLSRYYGIGN